MVLQTVNDTLFINNMDYPIETLQPQAFPPLLREIADPPTQLYVRGKLPPQGTKCLAVVGSRKYTSYGKQVVDRLIGGLKGYDIAVISGLALGIDGKAHEAALAAGLYTLAVPGSGLDDRVLYPSSHKHLAYRILESGGGMLSEFEPEFEAAPWSFPKRNRIMAGLAHAVLVIEATERSGTLITSRLATEYNRDVLAVPGSIFSEHTKGPHMLIRLGAVPVTSHGDILEALAIEAETHTKHTLPENLSKHEQLILDALDEPRDKDELFRITNITAQEFNTTLSLMELRDLIVVDMNTVRKNF